MLRDFEEWPDSWLVTVDDALTTPREEQTRPFFVPIPDDAAKAKALRRAGFSATAYLPGYYKRNPPKDSPFAVRSRPGLKAYLVARDGPGCRYCGSAGAVTFDHVVPTSRGGDWHHNNVVLACEPCNKDKDNRTLEEWRAGVIFHRRHCRTDDERAWFDSLAGWPERPRLDYDPATGRRRTSDRTT